MKFKVTNNKLASLALQATTALRDIRTIECRFSEAAKLEVKRKELEDKYFEELMLQ